MKIRQAARIATAAALVVGGIVVGVTPAQAAGSDRSFHGCPYGAVCLYPQNKGFNDNHYSQAFWSYGPHNVYNQVGTHTIVDNQYGSHETALCARANGKGGDAKLPGRQIVAESSTAYHPFAWSVTMTPVNSIDLERNRSNSKTCAH